ncbi:YlaI family protein [Paenisporosarcina sp. TG20]|uniref:YlaI family protein n=1 Tax=Paenisporosarcina sp. TG20 TaxID=1211706 RepID=UPI0002D97662|nr:YlaI family protein [Paenisporosarcina sp. TG20]
MRVKCVICEAINELPDDSPQSKKLRNRPIHTYMCDPCHERIEKKTLARLATGQFVFYKSSRRIEDEF